MLRGEPLARPLWPTVLSALVFGISFGRAVLGAGDTLDYRVPLATVLLIATTGVLVWAWVEPARSARASRTN